MFGIGCIYTGVVFLSLLALFWAFDMRLGVAVLTGSVLWFAFYYVCID